MTQNYETASELADALIARVGKRIVLGLPIGIGKAVHVADALFERAAADASLSLTIFTGLTLEPPRAGGELARRFLEPLAARLYADWPTPAYARAVRENRLPPNVEVREFYLRPGAYLGNPLAQRSYTSINYSHVVPELVRLGINVVAQLVSSRPESPGRLSLSSNPEITLDLLPHLQAQRRAGKPIAVVGQINRRLPYMLGDAELPLEAFDLVLDGEDFEFPLFPLPSRRVAPADYATAMHVASLVRDGGMLQIGIGSLSEAVAHCLRLRHCSPDVFARVLELLPGGTRSQRRAALPVERSPFEQGLFASTELLSDALLALLEAGIVRRPAGDGDSSLIQAGFFIGSTRLYASLNALEEDLRRRIRMTRISEVNTLFVEEARKRRQRRAATFVNETMMTTLLGAAVSDALEDGRVVSGVGGQFDFVAMAHALDDARSILMCRARRLRDGVPRSNIRWSYGHATVPRHFRDVVVSEYGIAATRGCTDEQVVAAMLAIADSAFQAELADAAKRAGKLARDYSLPDDARANTPLALKAIFDDQDVREHFPPYPLGTELTRAEQQLVPALEWLDNHTARLWPRLQTLAAALLRPGSGAPGEALERMGLGQPSGPRERVLRRLLALALARAAT